MADTTQRSGLRPLPRRLTPNGLRHRPPARLQSLHRARPEERAIRLFAVSLITSGRLLRSTELHGKRRD